MDKEIIIRNFSRYAHLYDRYAKIQKLTASELLKQTRGDSFASILEIGCGTGNYTRLLREKYRQAKLKALDISRRMIEVAQKKLQDKEIEFIVADAEGIYLDEYFDLITSHACFQWFENIEKALIKYKNLLKRGGLISFSTFGPLTFQELDTSLKYLLNGSFVYSQNFITKEKIKEILEINFEKICIKEKIYEESFSCLSPLLYKIKYTGVRGYNHRKIFLSRLSLRKLEELYLKNFGQIKATYQIFFCQGRAS